MVRFGDVKPENNFPRPIKPTGLGYRAVSNLFLVMALLAVALALLAMSQGDGGTAPLAFAAAGWCVSAGVTLRVVSDFLAVLADIARAVRGR